MIMDTYNITNYIGNVFLRWGTFKVQCIVLLYLRFITLNMGCIVGISGILTEMNRFSTKSVFVEGCLL